MADPSDSKPDIQNKGTLKGPDKTPTRNTSNCPTGILPASALESPVNDDPAEGR